MKFVVHPGKRVYDKFPPKLLNQGTRIKLIRLIFTDMKNFKGFVWFLAQFFVGLSCFISDNSVTFSEIQYIYHNSIHKN